MEAGAGGDGHSHGMYRVRTPRDAAAQAGRKRIPGIFKLNGNCEGAEQLR